MLRRSTQSTTQITVTQFLKWMHSGDHQLPSPTTSSAASKDIDRFLSELQAKHILKWRNLRQFSSLMSEERRTSATGISAMAQGVAQGMVLVTKAVLSDWQKLHSSAIYDLELRSVSEGQLSCLLESSIEERNARDFLYLIGECLKHRKLPSNRSLLESLRYLSELGHLKEIEAFAEICKNENDRRAMLRDNADLEPFRAVALWQKDSTQQALNVLAESYVAMCHEDTTTKHEQSLVLIRNTFRLLIADGLSKKSEAILVLAIRIATELYRSYHDIFMVACIWKECFISEWFLDQQAAQKLFDDHPELRKMVAKRSSNLCARLLECHHIDAVYRLLQLLLENNYRKPCHNCLELFFDYQYVQSNLRACLEIVRACHELNLPLDEMRSKQFINLLFHKDSSQRQDESRQMDTTKCNHATKAFRYTF